MSIEIGWLIGRQIEHCEEGMGGGECVGGYVDSHDELWLIYRDDDGNCGEIALLTAVVS